MDVYAISRVRFKDKNKKSFCLEKLIKKDGRFGWQFVGRQSHPILENQRIFFFYRLEEKSDEESGKAPIFWLKHTDFKFMTTIKDVKNKYLNRTKVVMHLK